MPILRFQTVINNWVENHLFSLIEGRDNISTLADGDLISLHLQFLHIEPGAFVYEELSNQAIWIAEFFPDGEYVERLAIMFSEATRISDNSVHTLTFPVDKSNMLVAHLTAEDSYDFQFHKSDKVVMQLRVTNIQTENSGMMEENLPTWTACLVPVGEVVNDTIFCEVTRLAE